jgi:hypothetical protein
VWINLADVDQESKIRWKIQDVEESYLVNVLDEIAQKEIAQLEGCMLQKKIFECNILRCEAKFCIFSDPNKAEQLLLDVENKLTKLKLEFPDHASSTITTELAHLNFVLAKILHDRTRGSQIGETLHMASKSRPNKLLMPKEPHSYLWRLILQGGHPVN